MKTMKFKLISDDCEDIILECGVWALIHISLDGIKLYSSIGDPRMDTDNEESLKIIGIDLL